MSQHSPSTRPYGAMLRIVTVASLAFAYLLVVAGDTVRVTESGMGCISWPLCNGQAGLAGSYHALLEQLHRYLAAIVTVLVVTTFVMAWRRVRENHLVYWSATAALGLIAVQTVLGAITVFANNAGWTVAVHLAVAWLILGAVTVSALGVWQAPLAGRYIRPRQPHVRGRGLQAIGTAPAGYLGLIAAAALFALSVSGMLVLHEGASNACPSWPLCGRGAAPTGWVVLQYLHRTLAFLAAVAVAAAVVRAWTSAPARRTGRVLACVAGALLAGTVTFGAIVATTGAPPVEQDLHLAVASALWIGVVALATPCAPRRVVTRDAPAAAATAGAATAGAATAGAATAGAAGTA